MYKIILMIYAIYLVTISIVTFFAYFIDKKKAQAKMYRTKEALLISLSMLGGAFLGYISMFLFHHKTKKWYFHFFNILGIIIHVTALYLLIKGL